MAVPFSSTVKVLDAARAGGAEVKPLFRTVESSYRQQDAMAITRGMTLSPRKEDQGPFVVAYAYSGKLGSFFAGKAKPEGVAAPAPPKPEEGGELMSAPKPGEVLTESPPQTRL